MTVKEFFDFMKETKFMITAERFKGSNVINKKEEMEFSLGSFGYGSYGGRYNNTFTFNITQILENRTKVSTRTFSVKEDIDEDILEMEIIKIEEIYLGGYVNESSSGNGYYQNYSKMTFMLQG